MTHQPQQILVRVECKDRLPDKTNFYLCDDKCSLEFYHFNHITKYWFDSSRELNVEHPQYWYEPATKIVLSVEEYLVMQEKLRIADEMVLEINKLKSLNTNP